MGSFAKDTFAVPMVVYVGVTNIEQSLESEKLSVADDGLVPFNLVIESAVI